MEGPIPIVVLGGYLGSGKTTLLNELLSDSPSRTGVIVNDFGELGVDAELLGDASDDGLIDLPNGCVCCALGTELGSSLEALAERQPRLNQIVIEASGVADPAALAAWGTVPGFSSGGVFVLAAADSIGRLIADRYVGREVERQLDAADVIVLTKTDLVDGEQLRDVRNSLARRNAPVIDRPASISELVLASVPCRRSPPTSSGTHQVEYDRWSWRPDSSLPPTGDELNMFVHELPSSVLRAKGVVTVASGAMMQICLVQVVGASRVVTQLGPRDDNAADFVEGLVAVGVRGHLDSDRLDQLASRYLSPRG